MNTETISQQQPHKANLFQKGFHRLQRTKPYQRVERSFAWKLAKNAVGEDFFTRMGGAENGVLLIVQGVGAMILSLPLLLGAVYCALIAAGLYGVRYGLAGLWNSVEKNCEKTCPTFNPLKKIRESSFIQNLHGSQKRIINRVAQNHLFKKVMRLPPVQKLLDSRLMKPLTQGLTPNQRDVFVSGIAIEGSLFTIAVCARYFVKHVAAPAALGFIPVVGMGFAAYEIVSSMFGLYCYSKTLMRVSRERKAAKQLLENKPDAEPAVSPPSQETKNQSASAPAAPAFNKEAGRPEAKDECRPDPHSENEPHRNLASSIASAARLNALNSSA